MSDRVMRLDYAKKLVRKFAERLETTRTQDFPVGYDKRSQGYQRRMTIVLVGSEPEQLARALRRLAGKADE